MAEPIPVYAAEEMAGFAERDGIGLDEPPLMWRPNRWSLVGLALAAVGWVAAWYGAPALCALL